MKLPGIITKLCMPAKIYLGLTVFSTLCYLAMMFHAESETRSTEVNVHTYTIFGLISQLAFALFWVVFLNYLCLQGYKKLSWFFLFMPFIFMAFLLIMGMFLITYSVANINLVDGKVTDLKDQHTYSS